MSISVWFKINLLKLFFFPEVDNPFECKNLFFAAPEEKNDSFKNNYSQKRAKQKQEKLF